MVEELTNKETAEQLKQAAKNIEDAVKLLVAHSTILTEDEILHTSSIGVIDLLKQTQAYYELYDAHDNR